MMKLKFLSMLATLATAAPFRNWANHTFAEYAQQYGKVYSSAEAGTRKERFEARVKQIVEHNEGYARGDHTWYAAVNEFTDWTEEEVVARKTGRRGVSRGPRTTLPLGTRAYANPSRFDWREHNVVTEVKDQGGCGSCWAFAASETMESHYAIATGELLVLSPQNYVSCAPNDQHCGGTGGCSGSIPELAFNHTATHGLALEADFPYTGRDDACPPVQHPTVTCDGYVKLPENSAMALETALATVGPVAVSVATTGWSTYGGGIFSGGCSYPLSPLLDCTLNHVVVVVGYDTTGDGYWKVRNSWGKGTEKVPAWGEGGYMRLSRKNSNKTFTDSHPSAGVACEPFPVSQQVGGESGILFDMSYPVGVRKAASQPLFSV